MVFTLQRYVFRELFKVFVGAVMALTLILSLGSILRPIQEYGVGPGQIIGLLVYFLPITLTFVLPIGALFAAALIYGRLASDNELDACRASGISLLTIVYPGLSLAVLTAIATLILSFHTVPAFIKRAEKAIKADAKQILFRNIQRRGYYTVPGHKYRIYADAGNPEKNELLGVIVAEVGKKQQIKRLITAEKANVHFEPHKGLNVIKIVAHKAYQVDAKGEAYFEWLPVAGEMPSLLADNIKFKKIKEMKMIQADLMRFYPIASLARKTYAQMMMETLAEDISTRFADQADKYYTLQSTDRRVVFTAQKCQVEAEEMLELSGDVTALEYDAASGQQICSWHCNRAVIELQDEPASRLMMIVYNAYRQNKTGMSELAQRKVFRGLNVPRAVENKLPGTDCLDSINKTMTKMAKPSSYLMGMQRQLQRKIESTIVEIRAEIHSRLVFGIGCISMILIGIGLGIIFRDGHLLTAFGISSLPAGFLIVCIMMGKNLTKNKATQPGMGILLMWGGLLFLSVLTVAIYRKLLRT